MPLRQEANALPPHVTRPAFAMHFRFLPLALLAAAPALAQPRAGLDASASVMRFAEHGYGSRTYGTLEAGVPVRLGARTTLAPGVLW